MKKFLALLLAMVMTAALVACGGGSDPAPSTTPDPAPSTTPADDNKKDDPAPAPAEPAGDTEITVWLYPVGGWGDESKVKPLVDSFTADTGIKVNVEWLAYADGDDKVNTAIAAQNAPDLERGAV